MGNWRTIITFTYPHEAHLAKTLLESEGINTIIQDELTAQVNNFYSNAIGGVKLLVSESDFEQGIDILSKGGYINPVDIKTKTELIIEDKIIDKSRCPFCNSKNIRKKRDPDILTVIIYFLLGAIFPIFKRTFMCYDCHKEWKYVENK